MNPKWRPTVRKLRPRLYSIDDDTHDLLRAVGKALEEAGISADRRHGGASAAVRWIVRDWERHGGLEHVRELERARKEGRDD